MWSLGIWWVWQVLFWNTVAALNITLAAEHGRGIKKLREAYRRSFRAASWASWQFTSSSQHRLLASHHPDEQ
jgi:hypothetical protein